MKYAPSIPIPTDDAMKGCITSFNRHVILVVKGSYQDCIDKPWHVYLSSPMTYTTLQSNASGALKWHFAPTIANGIYVIRTKRDQFRHIYSSFHSINSASHDQFWVLSTRERKWLPTKTNGCQFCQVYKNTTQLKGSLENTARSHNSKEQHPNSIYFNLGKSSLSFQNNTLHLQTRHTCQVWRSNHRSTATLVSADLFITPIFLHNSSTWNLQVQSCNCWLEYHQFQALQAWEH